MKAKWINLTLFQVPYETDYAKCMKCQVSGGQLVITPTIYDKFLECRPTGIYGYGEILVIYN